MIKPKGSKATEEGSRSFVVSVVVRGFYASKRCDKRATDCGFSTQRNSNRVLTDGVNVVESTGALTTTVRVLIQAHYYSSRYPLMSVI